MALVELAVEIISPLLRVVGHFFVEVVVEVLVHGAGYLICYPFSKKVEPGDRVVLIVGLVFWTVVIAVGLYSLSYFEDQLSLDIFGRS